MSKPRIRSFEAIEAGGEERRSKHGLETDRERGIALRLMVALLSAYKRYLSPLLPRACRFAPTCSEYAKLAVLEHGVFRGGLLAGRRMLRCHPIHPGGIDLP